jgi:hypothetical protein
MFVNLPRKLLILGLLVVAALPFVAVAGTSATPDPTCVPPTPNDSQLAHCVHTLAESNGGAGTQRPVVLYKWELPDMNPNVAGMQYTDSTDGGAVSTGTACPTPNPLGCINTTGNDLPDNKGQYHHHHDDADPRKAPGQMQVRPNLDDKPEKRTIEVWAIVMDPNGAADIDLVQAHIFDSSGAKKTFITLGQRACSALGTSNTTLGLGPQHDVLGPQHAAENTGQLEHGVVQLHQCNKGQWRVYSGTFLLNNDQPDGKYTVRVDATDGEGTGVVLENQFTVLNVVAFKIDFQTVNYGLIAAGTRQVRPGDFTYGNGIPTIRNTGNDEACLTLDFSIMEGKVRQADITEFDASLWVNDPPELLKFVAGVPQQFAKPLPPKLDVQLDFSVDPPSPLPSDIYQGTVDLSVKKDVEGCGPTIGP